MDGTVGQKKRLIQVTEADLRKGELCLTGNLGFFPAACFGPSSKNGPAGRPLTLDVEGLAEPVLTDIPCKAGTDEPRGFFRDRSWVPTFFKACRLQPGGFVAIEKLDRFHIRVTRAREDDIRSHLSLLAGKSGRLDRLQADSEDNGRKSYPWPAKAPNGDYHPATKPDTRGLAAIKRVDWRSFRTADLFAGIGGIRLGFQAVGGRGVFASETDELAAETYEANFGEKPRGDITAIHPADVPDHDILLAGFPCQPFSIIGGRKGFGDTRGTLFFNVEEILRAKSPPAALLENVKQFKTHDGGRTFRTVIGRLADLGYHTHTAVLNALHYGVPQTRERTFIVCFRAGLEFAFPKPLPAMPSLDAVLEPDGEVDPKFLASGQIQAKRLERLREQGRSPFYPSVWHENKGGVIGIHPFSCALRHNASHNYLLVNGRRRLTPRECLRLQGFPESFKIAVSDRAIRAQTGNSVAVPVIRAIAKEMIRSLSRAKLCQREETSAGLVAGSKD